MGWKRYQTVDSPPPTKKREPQVGRGLFVVHLLIFQFKFQFSKCIKSLTFHIFLNLTYLWRKNISFPECPKIAQKCIQNCQTVVNEISRGIRLRLKRDLDIGRKAMLSDVKTPFTFTPGLKVIRVSGDFEFKIVVEWKNGCRWANIGAFGFLWSQQGGDWKKIIPRAHALQEWSLRL